MRQTWTQAWPVSTSKLMLYVKMILSLKKFSLSSLSSLCKEEQLISQSTTWLEQVHAIWTYSTEFSVLLQVEIKLKWACKKMRHKIFKVLQWWSKKTKWSKRRKTRRRARKRVGAAHLTPLQASPRPAIKTVTKKERVALRMKKKKRRARRRTRRKRNTRKKRRTKKLRKKSR